MNTFHAYSCINCTDVISNRPLSMYVCLCVLYEYVWCVRLALAAAAAGR